MSAPPNEQRVSAPPNERRRGGAGPSSACETAPADDLQHGCTAPQACHALARAHDRPALCVAIHDVAPDTWRDCLRLLQAVREVADIPLTWLVVPRWHGSAAPSAALDATLGSMLADGHELALHGYTHLDSAARARRWRDRFLRGVYTEGEGEFAALDAGEARRRIDLGLAWFAARGWPVNGFVPPAWLLGNGAWEAVRSYSFLYTTTWSHFHCLMEPGQRSDQLRPAPQQVRTHQAGTQQAETQQAETQQAVPPQRPLSRLFLKPSFPRRREPKFTVPPMQCPGALLSPSLVYASRNRAGRIVSSRAASLLAWMLRDAPLVRLALHPRDARHPALLRHAQVLIDHLLQTRVALTKSDFARQWAGATSTAPTIRPATSATAQAPHNSADSRSAADRRAR